MSGRKTFTVMGTPPGDVLDVITDGYSTTVMWRADQSLLPVLLWVGTRDVSLSRSKVTNQLVVTVVHGRKDVN